MAGCAMKIAIDSVVKDGIIAGSGGGKTIRIWLKDSGVRELVVWKDSPRNPIALTEVGAEGHSGVWEAGRRWA